ncbi:MAG: hypothetical protein RL115_1083 [Bacteroidota bacterium]
MAHQSSSFENGTDDLARRVPKKRSSERSRLMQPPQNIIMFCLPTKNFIMNEKTIKLRPETKNKRGQET